jgi:hypothetical protein
MANHSPALISLCECLRGVLPSRPDWLSILGLANEALITPALIDFVDQFDEKIPNDVSAYVREIYQRNEQRNDRLAAQLHEAIAALNESGVTPVLLKGAARLATASSERRATRLMNDLDILVAPEQAEIALKALTRIGCEALDFQAPPDGDKWFSDLKQTQDVGMIDLKRPRDVGVIDLHMSLPGSPYFYGPAGNILQHCKLTPVAQTSAYVPTATYQALVLIVHDQFQDYDYWIGGIDLRHLLELRDLNNSPEGIDWDLLASFAPGRLARNGLESQLVALANLLEVDVPASMRSRLMPRLQYRRRLAQARFPIARWPLLAAAVLDYPNYRRGPDAECRPQRGQSGRRPWSIPRIATLRFMLGMAGKHRIGKV